MPEQNYRLYYISDNAYNHLVLMAQRQGFVSLGAIKKKGLGNFINRLAQCSFIDTRPDIILKRHTEEMSYGHAPRWTSYGIRKSRALRLNDKTTELLFGWALHFGIYPREPTLFGGPARTSPHPTVGIVIEAIGLKWLTPTEWPRAE